MMDFACPHLMRLNKNAKGSSHLNQVCVHLHSRALLKSLRCLSKLASHSDWKECQRGKRKFSLEINKIICSIRLCIHNPVFGHADFSSFAMSYKASPPPFFSFVTRALLPNFYPCRRQGVVTETSDESEEFCCRFKRTK